MDYNTSRKKLLYPEYGRHIQQMVDHALTIEDKEKRQKAAETIVSIMANMYPNYRDILDFKHKMWDHLIIMSDFKLEVDSPFERPTPAKLTEKPRRLGYGGGRIRFKHYGKTMQRLIEQACEMPDGEEKEHLVKIIANHMKKLYLLWNRQSVNDKLIIRDINELSKGNLKIDDEMILTDTKEILYKTKRPKKGGKPSKR